MKLRFFGTLTVALALLALVVPALAHEPRVVDGTYQIAFGWRSEPAYAGLLNGPEVFVSLAATQEATSEATEGVDQGATDDDEGAPIPADTPIDLKVEVSFGDQTMNVPMRFAWGEVGHLVGDLIPTRPGDYSFHVTGTIGETKVDETFTSADGKFGTVEPVEDIMFPKAQ